MAKILVVDDEPSFLATLTALLGKQNYEVVSLNSGEKALEVIKTATFDLVLLDVRMAPISGLDLLNVMQADHADTPVVMITGDDTIETAVGAMKQGAFDYVTKPFKVDELFQTVKRALNHHRVSLANLFPFNRGESKYHLDNIVTVSPNMQDVGNIVKRVAPTLAPVFITGESGTGKALIAKAIHLHSNRRDEPFVMIDCASIPGALFDEFIFGVVTSDGVERAGLLDAAERGTAFIAGLEAMPVAIQSKLIQTLRYKTIVRAGGGKSIPVDLRVIAASSQSPDALMQAGRVDGELLKVMSIVIIHLDPLRDRRQDIMPLAACFIQQEAPADRTTPAMDKAAKRALETYDWPGNAGELRAAMQHALKVQHDDIITRDDLPPVIKDATTLEGANLANADRGKSLRIFLQQKKSEYIAGVASGTDGGRDKRMVPETPGARTPAHATQEPHRPGGENRWWDRAPKKS